MSDIFRFLEFLPFLLLIYGVLRYLMRAFFSNTTEKRVPRPKRSSSPSEGPSEEAGEPLDDIFGDTRRRLEEMFGGGSELPEEAAEEELVDVPVPQKQADPASRVREARRLAWADKQQQRDREFAARYPVGEAEASVFHRELLDTFADGTRVRQALIAGEILRPKFDEGP